MFGILLHSYNATLFAYGQTGAGKSTLANVLSGKPGYTILDGEILYDGKDLLLLEPHERSHAMNIARLAQP